MASPDRHSWPPTWAVVSSVLLTVIGLGLSAYLTYAHYVDTGALACPDSATVNCAKVTTSSQSKVFGVVPVALLGLGYFVAMLALCVPAAWRSGIPPVHRLRLAGVVTGVGMVIYLLYAELFQIDAICVYCTAVHVVTVLLFVIVINAESSRGSLGPLPPG